MTIRKATILPGLLLSAIAAAFPVEFDVNTEGVEVDIVRVEAGEAVVLRVRNYEDAEIRCDLTFRNGPEIARQRKISVEAGEQRVVRWNPSRNVVRIRVSGSCWRSDEARAAG